MTDPLYRHLLGLLCLLLTFFQNFIYFAFLLSGLDNQATTFLLLMITLTIPSLKWAGLPTIRHEIVLESFLL